MIKKTHYTPDIYSKTLISKAKILTIFFLFFSVSFLHGQDAADTSSSQGNANYHPEAAILFSNRIFFDKYALSNIDAVEIDFPADSTFFVNGVYPLNEEKCMQLPAIEPVCLIGKSINDISKILESSYSDYVRYPFVRIKLLMRIGLLGGFHEPGLYYAYPLTSLWDVIAMGGGPKREDGFRKMKWRRKELVVQKDLTEELVSGKTLKDLNFKSGDVIAVVDRPKIGFWTALRTEVFPFILMIASVTTAYATVWAVSNME